MTKELNVRELLGKHGSCRPQSVDEWKGDIPLPEAVARFYQEVGPVDIGIRGYGNDMFMPRLAQIWELQAGYRWDGRTREACSDWRPEWLVVADQGGDAYIYDSAQDCVLFAEHGMGEWDPVYYAPSIDHMAACLAALGAIRVDAGFGFTDDDSNILPEYIDSGLTALTEILGDPKLAKAVLVIEGWIFEGSD